MGDVPGMDGGEPRGIEQVSAVAAGERGEGDRRVRGPVGGGADLARGGAARGPFEPFSAAAITPMALTAEVLPWSFAVLMEV